MPTAAKIEAGVITAAKIEAGAISVTDLRLGIMTENEMRKTQAPKETYKPYQCGGCGAFVLARESQCSYCRRPRGV